MVGRTVEAVLMDEGQFFLERGHEYTRSLLFITRWTYMQQAYSSLQMQKQFQI